MHKRAHFLFGLILIFIASCTKFDTTNIGGDLVPAVDNINTFADTLNIIASQGDTCQGGDYDSTKMSLSENHLVGHISDDGLFGSTDAELYLQLKPNFYPYFIGLYRDTIIKPDSVVLCLSYKGCWGDSSTPMTFQVFEVPNTQHGLWDSINQYNPISYRPSQGAALSSPKTIYLNQLGSYTKFGIKGDSVNNQIRIKLNDNFRDLLFSRDSSSTNYTKNAFYNDSLFRLFNNGFMIKATSGNALTYVDLYQDGKTRLELHYSKKNKTSDTSYSALDTTYSYWYFKSGFDGSTVRNSSLSNYIKRQNRVIPASDPVNGNQEIWLQTTPGTFATLNIPQLDTNSSFFRDTLKNCIINRAELEINEVADLTQSTTFTAPGFMYLDLVDSVNPLKYKPIYRDLNPNTFYDPDYKNTTYPFFPTGNRVDYSYFGGYQRKRGTQTYYTINITRYLQQLVTNKGNNYKMRLFPAHSFRYNQYSPYFFQYGNSLADGRVKVGGGNNANPNYRMRLRIVYSKCK